MTETFHSQSQGSCNKLFALYIHLISMENNEKHFKKYKTIFKSNKTIDRNTLIFSSIREHIR